MTRRVRLDVDRRSDHLLVRWEDRRTTGEARFDHLGDAVPTWLASADELLGDTDRRTADAVLDALARWADESGESVGVWRHDDGVEILTVT